MSAQLQKATNRYLATTVSASTRKANLAALRTWQRFCNEHGLHVLDVQGSTCQLFVDWMAGKYSPLTTRNRAYAVRRWLDAMVTQGVVKAHGMSAVKLPDLDDPQRVEVTVSDQDIANIIQIASTHGPRWEWMLGMLATSGCEAAELKKVKATDVRSWEGRTLIKVRSASRFTREIAVTGRLEQLTLGLSAVFAPTTTLFPKMATETWRTTIQDIMDVATSRVIFVRELRASAIRRQYDAGVPLPVMAKWLGVSGEAQVRKILGLPDPTELVEWEEVWSAITLDSPAPVLAPYERSRERYGGS